MQQKIPNLIVIGVSKGGTTSLYEYLRSHPQICSPHAKKEIRYFYPAAMQQTLAPIEDYARYFLHCPNNIPYRIEASPAYFLGGGTIINTMNSTLANDSKFICILREPVSRVESFWRYLSAQMLIEPMSFDAYVERCLNFPAEKLHTHILDEFSAIETGKYIKFLKIWFEHFGNERFKIVFLENMNHDPQSALQEIGHWLSLDPDGFAYGKKYNVTVPYRWAWMHRITLMIRRGGEPIFNRYESLRRGLRSMYYAINGTGDDRNISEDRRQQLFDFFKPYNDDLRKLLHKNGYDSAKFPLWLSS